MNNKIVFFAFKGEMICFLHVLINALDLNEKGHHVRIVFEGEAVKLLKPLEEGKIPVYLKCKEKRLIDCICEACSKKLGVYEQNQAYEVPFNSELMGHPSMERFIREGFSVITL